MSATRKEMLANEMFRLQYSPGCYDRCRFCRGNGCAGCDGEAAKDYPTFLEEQAARDAEYLRQFPNGPIPLATFRRDSPEDMAKLKEVFGAEALQKAFGPGGGGMSEVIQKLEGAHR